MKRLCLANKGKVILLSAFAILLNFGHVGTSFSDTVSGMDVTYTTDADFNQGMLVNVNHDITPDQIQLNRVTTPFPFINVAASGRGTVVRIDVNTGQILGEYYTAPSGMGRDPSRTTVDLNGNVWVANRAEASYSPAGSNTPKGSVTRVGLVIGGTRVDKDGTPNPTGQYLKPPFQYNTCIDRDGDGLIKTSRSLGNILPWTNTGGSDTHGGVSTAEDECIINYTRVISTGTRTVAVDANNDVWVGGENTAHEKISGITGQPVPGTQFNLGCGGYGGFVDKNGVLWSARYGNGLLRFDTKMMTGQCLGNSMGDYGLGVDPATGNIWHTFLYGNLVAKIAPDGSLIGRYSHGNYYAQGVAVDGSGNVWVAQVYTTVGHLRTDGTFVGIISLPGGNGSTGVAVDANGKIWVTNRYSDNVMRIDPNAGPVGGGGYKVGAVDLTIALGSGAYPYNYSDMTGYVAIGTTSPQGTWAVTQDSGLAGNRWGRITWNTEPEGSQPEGTEIIVEARSSDTETGLASQSYLSVTNGNPFLLIGRFIQARVTLKPNASGASPVLPNIRINSSFAYVHVIDTISNNNITLDQNSFVRTPSSITSAGDKTIVEWHFNSFTLDQQEDLSFDVILKNPLPGENRLVNHKLEILYEDIEGKPVQTELGPYYVHVLISAFNSTIVTDKPVYKANEDVNISDTIKNLSDYTRTIDTKIIIEDTRGVLAKEVATLPNLTFAAGEEKSFGNLIFNTGTTYSGDYRARLLLYENQKQVGEASTNFTIEAIRTINSKVVTDKLTYNANQPVTITSSIKSQSPNYIFSKLNAKIELLNSQGTTLLTDSKTIPILTLGQLIEMKTYWNTATNPKGMHTVTLEVFEGLAVISTSTTSFEILGSSQTSEGIIGAITAGPSPIYKGNNETLSYSIINNGNEDVSNLNVKVLIVNPDTQEIKNTFESTIDLPMNTTLTGNFIALTSTLDPRIYMAILQVSSSTMTQPKTLASATFEVIQSQHTLTASSGPNGTISPSGSITVDRGASQTFTITPDAGYHVADVWVDGVSVEGITTYTFVDITTDHTIEASFAQGVYSLDLPRTGQITRYAQGDDGWIRAGIIWPIPRFTMNADTTITDNLTGLIWAPDAGTSTIVTCIGGPKTWQDALDYMACLNANNYLGHSDWRLPNVNELESLIHAGQIDNSAWLISQGFINVAMAYYWSSTTLNNSPNQAWAVNLQQGDVTYGPKDSNNHVWPVCGMTSTPALLWRTGQTITYAIGDDGDLREGIALPMPRLIANADATLTDKLTGLVWAPEAGASTFGSCTGGPRTWQEALDYISCLNTNNYLGHNDWRLPNRKELRSLIHYGQSNIADWLNVQGFINANPGEYWSSTTYALSQDTAWSVDMVSGEMGVSNKSTYLNLLPVRAGTVIPNQSPNPAPIGGGVYQFNTPVILGGQVSDFDGDLVTYEWLEGDRLLISGQIETVYGGSPVNLPEQTITLGLGNHIITLRVSDGVNQPVTSDVNIEMIDTTAPVLAPVPDKTILWPPNHKMVDITIWANAADNTGDLVELEAVVTSNEPQNGLGDGDTSPDWTEPVIDQINGIITLQLRAERSGTGNGRIYTITITGRDVSGNESQAKVEIIVPHDKGKK